MKLKTTSESFKDLRDAFKPISRELSKVLKLKEIVNYLAKVLSKYE
jgi:hypothetical protein